jgi:hypothetical protein
MYLPAETLLNAEKFRLALGTIEPCSALNQISDRTGRCILSYLIKLVRNGDIKTRTSKFALEDGQVQVANLEVYERLYFSRRGKSYQYTDLALPDAFLV